MNIYGTHSDIKVNKLENIMNVKNCLELKVI